MNIRDLTDKDLILYRKKIQYEVSKYHNFQMAKKISLNSVYGATGNEYFRMYDPRLAEAVTLSGQYCILWLEKCINKYINAVLKTVNVDYVVAIDTDGIYITLEKLVEKMFPDETDTSKIINFVDKFCNVKLQEIIDSACVELALYTNAFKQKIVMKREAIANKGIWTAKKRYILNVYDNEGVRYATPQLKIMGNEAIRSSTPEICRKMIKETFRLLMQDSKENTLKYISECEDTFRKMPVESIAFPRSVRGLKQYSDVSQIYKKSTPIHVRGSLLYNEQLKKLELTKKYQSIKEGEKIRFVYLKEPNTLREDVISFIDKLPDEFGLTKYIDYDKQFDKTFLDPLGIIFKTIGWELQETTKLSEFFI